MSYAIGIDLGGSSVKSVAVTPEGQTLSTANLNFDADAQMDWAEKIRSLVEQFQREHGAPAEAIGLSAPGLAALNGRSIAHMPGRLQGLERLDWTSFLCSPRPVPVLNDGHAALLGEAWLGAARGFENAIMLTLGTGVGGAAIVDGELLRGHIGRAGHLGHICLDIDGPPDVCRLPGSLEVAIGNCTIVERSRGRFNTTHDLVAAHVAGDSEASSIWLRSVRALACAIASFVNILDPEVVIIGGGIAHSGAALFEPLRRFVDEVEWQPGGQRVKILPATLGELAGAYGAARNGTMQGGPTGDQVRLGSRSEDLAHHRGPAPPR
jgi:glucokinase